MAQTRQHLRVALAGKDRADNPKAGRAGDVGDDVVELKIRLAATRARKKAAEEAAKPKIVATVSEKMAEAIKHDPTSLRLSARAERTIPLS
jgi:hypothetical protein